MENRTLASLEINNNKRFVPAVLGFYDALISHHHHYDIARCNQLRFVATHVLLNRIEQAYPNAMGSLFIDFAIVDDYLEISIRDKGVPHWVDFSYSETRITKDADTLQKFILDQCVDCVGIEKLGKNGQRIYLRQKIRNPIHFEPPKPYPETTALDTNITIKAVSTPEDAIEAIRCIYSEYGYSYAYEKLYYVDNLLRMIENGEILCFLAVNDHGQTAGHFALAFSDLFNNMPELSTVVTRKEFRGLGLFAKFIEHAETYAKEHGIRAIMAQPVAFHPISQKAFLRGNYTATSLLLSYIGADTESEYNQNHQRLDLFACVKMMDNSAKTTLYPPCQLKEWIAKICSNAGLNAELKDDKQTADHSLVHIEENTALQMKRVVLSQAGEDALQILKDTVTDSIRKKHEMIELFLSLRDPSCEAGYLAAKHAGFVLSGLLPGSENDDYLVMQVLLKSELDYDHLVTVGEFEELTQDIKTLARKE
ncbi:MAG: GNAT family N-acetyltransferase [Clostridia bacterium]|nr:GNAT family N-acetyltransferase [Clostridia bacterium]